MNIMMKKIKILTHGPIRIKGFINGPVLTPYYEDTDTIFKMITSGIDIVEVCDNGTEIKLDISNFTLNNNKEKISKEVKKPIEEDKVVEKVETITAENTTDVSDNVDTTDNTMVEKNKEDTTTYKNYNNFNNKHKKNK